MRRTKLLALLTSLVLAATVGIARPRVARADASCPYMNYLGNYPQDEELNWSENIQGVAHDDGHWFFTQTGTLIQLPVGFDLHQDPPFNVDPNDDIRRVGIPDVMADQGYNHFGDIDQYGGFIFAPIEKQSDPKRSAIAVFRASDLEFLSYVEVTSVQGGHAGWIAFDPGPGFGVLYSSGEEVSSTEPLTRYYLDLSNLRQTNDIETSLSLLDNFYLHEADGSDLARGLKTMQGGVFTPWGDLFIINGYYDGDPDELRGGIHLFDPSGNLIVESTNGSGNFNFEYHPDDPDDDEEPEGIDWWSDPVAPMISGQLHAVMIDNTNHLTESVPDDLYFKHYTVDYSCRAAVDTDGDGLFDNDEVYVYGTDPLSADSDGDGLSDGREVTDYDTDPLSTDTDGDGLSDGDEVNLYGSDPTKTDTDGDGLSDADEVNVYGTSPTLADTDGDGVSDGDEIAHGTDPTDKDSDDDGLPDGLEIAYGTNPALADTDGDGLVDGQDVEFVQNAVRQIASSGFRPPGQGTKKAILIILDDVEVLLVAGHGHAPRKLIALRKLLAVWVLTQLRSHLDGCGTSPDRNDWILNCQDQIEIRGLVDLLIGNLTS